MRIIVRSALEDKFDAIWEASEGETAIELVYRRHPDVVVLDYSMPRMDGEAVAKSIRLLSPGSRIVVFTGALSVPPKWALDCDAYVDKPYIDRLVQVVADLQPSGR